MYWPSAGIPPASPAKFLGEHYFVCMRQLIRSRSTIANTGELLGVYEIFVALLRTYVGKWRCGDEYDRKTKRPSLSFLHATSHENCWIYKQDLLSPPRRIVCRQLAYLVFKSVEFSSGKVRTPREYQIQEKDHLTRIGDRHGFMSQASPCPLLLFSQFIGFTKENDVCPWSSIALTIYAYRLSYAWTWSRTFARFVLVA